MDDFEIVDRPHYVDDYGSRYGALNEAVADTAETGQAIRFPLNGRTASAIRRSFSIAMKHRGLKAHVTIRDGNCVVWATKGLKNEGLDRANDRAPEHEGDWMPSIVEEPITDDKLPRPLDDRERAKLIIAVSNAAKTLALSDKPVMVWMLCTPELKKQYRHRAHDLVLNFAIAIGDLDLVARLREIQ